MASLVLGAVGSAIGGAFGGTILGLSGAAIGGAVGTMIGGAVDSWLLSSMQPGQRSEGQRLDSLRVTTASEGGVIPRVYGRMRVSGNVIWATDFVEEIVETRQGGGKGGGGGGVTTVEYLYSCSFAVALCEGVITGITRMWADGKLMDLSGVTWRVYPGNETQTYDPLIASFMGAETPAYRGTAYVVFENLPLADFGNRLPQITFEVHRPIADADTAEGLVKAVTLIPASGEFTYATESVRKKEGGTTTSINVNALPQVPDLLVSINQLLASCPGLQSVSLVISWFGNDLRCGSCLIRPGVEVAVKDTQPVSWSVDGVGRGSAYVVSQVGGKPVYGGTPSDRSVVQAIQELKARGIRVTFYPFVLMDIPSGNSLPNPYSNSAATPGQPAFPWRGRITCSPAAGYTGSPDKAAAAGSQIATFFGNATPASFSVSGTTVSYTGTPGDWGLARMVLHYAHLCAAAGGVDAFLIGSEMRGITQVRNTPAQYPAVARFQTLAADVRSIVGGGTKIGYAADWSEYFGHHPGDGSNDVRFHLDNLWADSNIDFIGIDNYMPLSDWRDGFSHADAAASDSIYDRDYLQSNVAGGEGFDWFYASDADRASQTRTPISDGAYGKPWVYRYKDLINWWSNHHYNRPAGVQNASPTAWVPESKPIWFTEFGCPAVDRGANQPNVFYDPKSAESFVPYFSRGWRDDSIQRAYIEATLLYWGEPANNPWSAVYGGRMVHVPECAVWTWDARPYPFFPAREEVWSDGVNWLLGHWLGGRLGAASLAGLVRDLCRRAGLSEARIDVSGLWGAVEGYTITAIESPRSSIAILGQLFGFDAVESQGVMRFIMRGGRPVVSVDEDGLVRGGGSELIEVTRGQETELPRLLKWQITRSDEEYDMATVEARRGVADAARTETESYPVCVPPEEAERWCRRSLQERWIGRESATFELPPSMLAIDPSDPISITRDGRALDYRIGSVADGEVRRVEATRTDRDTYDLPPGSRRASALARPVVLGGVDAIFMDLPMLRDGDLAHQPLIAATASPWPGQVAVFRSPETDGFELLTTFRGRVKHGALYSALGAGPLGVFDMANELVVDMAYGKIVSVTDTALFAGANVFALKTPAGWEIVQAGVATLIAPSRYRLTRLLRGQFGTEDGMVSSLAPGSAFFALDSTVSQLPIRETEIGLLYNWRVGPAARPVTDDTYEAEAFAAGARGLKPWSVCNVEQPKLVGYAGGNLTIRWVRRDRALLADSWETASVPMSEAAEAYEVDILSGASVLRTLTSASPSVVYSSAQQIADWGAALAPGGTLTVRIFQMSAAIGRGVPLNVTLNL